MLSEIRRGRPERRLDRDPRLSRQPTTSSRVVTDTPVDPTPRVLDLGKTTRSSRRRRRACTPPRCHSSSRAPHRILVVRPAWASERGVWPMRCARLVPAVGKGYDFLGLVGLNVPERYYCSELAIAVYKGHIPAAVHIPRPGPRPSQLHYWGKILYDSGNPPPSIQ